MGHIDDIGIRNPSFLPAFLPDETFYSLCARFHNLSGNRLAATTSHLLFGVQTAAMLHDFPTHLAAFQLRTASKLGDVTSLARSRTLLRFYSPYQPARRINAGIEAMAGEGIDRLKFRLGLPSSRMGATHPLKACARCIEEELHRYGCAYWHLQQQHPVVWICTKHHELLMRSTGKSRIRNKLQWILPHALAQDEWTSLPEILREKMSLLQRLDEFARGAADPGVLHLDPIVLRQCYLSGAHRWGWLTKHGSVRLKIVREAFLDQFIGLLEIPEFNFLESVGAADGGFLAKLLRNPRAYLHPAKHLIVKSFLFESWRDFWSTYLDIACVSQQVTLKPYNTPRVDSKLAELISMVRARQMSLAQIAKNLELPYDVARYWLKRAGVKYIPAARRSTA